VVVSARTEGELVMPSRFTQLGGAAGADMALREMVAQRIAAALEQRKQQVENYKLGQTDRGLDLEGGRLTEDQRQFDADAPHREASTGYLRTQSKHLEGTPLREADARAHAGMIQEQGHQNELAQIQAQGNQSARVAGIRTASTGDDLRTFEEKEKIKAKYGGSRPSLGAERTALSYFNRAKQASDDIGGMEEGIAKMGLMGQTGLQVLPNFMQSAENQQYRQAQRAFTEARLRKESGAAIPTAEYDNDSKTYFAQPGDGPDVIAQKRDARQRVLEGLQFSSGKAYEEFFGEPNKPRGATGQPQGGVSIKSIRQVK
jgi:hypothetical protein